MKLGTSAALAVVLLLMAAPAYAYIDPGSGSMLVQFLTGGAAGAVILARLYWRRFRDNLSGKAVAADGAAPTEDSRQPIARP
jgi:hypothetical protein